jgi:hypothetical protein
MRALSATMIAGMVLLVLGLVPEENPSRPVTLGSNSAGAATGSMNAWRHENSSRVAQYSFCGACSQNSDCGPGNLCCQGDCPAGKYKCYAVSACPNAYRIEILGSISRGVR